MEQVSLNFEAKELPNTQTLGQIDPFASVELVGIDGAHRLVGFTDVVTNTQSPKWATTFVVDYTFECAQQIIVKTYNKHSSTPVGASPNHQVLGSATFKLSDVVSHSSKVFKVKYSDGPAQKSGADLVVQGEAVASTRDIFIGKFQASGLNRMNGLGIFGKSDPFFVVSKMMENGNYAVVHKSMFIASELNPHWPECRIPLVPLCNGDLDRPLKVEIFDFESSGKHKYMGEVSLTLRRILHDGKTGFDIIEPEKKKAKGGSYTNSGRLAVIDALIEHHPTFQEYLRGGLEISLMVAIDFTASNGDPKDATSLHHVDPRRLNAYQQALMQVGTVLEPYDADRKYPIWGFGCRVRTTDGTWTPVQHCFTVQDDATGCAGMLSAYEHALSRVGLSGPTLFADVIDTAGAVAASTASCPGKYHILLIITDGTINDLEATKAALIRASSTPLSIIVVGVGSEDFTCMTTLDGDDKVMSSESGKHKAERDIVQFVAHRDYEGKPPQALAQAVLAEVPTQVLQYMGKRGILPSPPK